VLFKTSSTKLAAVIGPSGISYKDAQRTYDVGPPGQHTRYILKAPNKRHFRKTSDVFDCANATSTPVYRLGNLAWALGARTAGPGPDVKVYAGKPHPSGGCLRTFWSTGKNPNGSRIRRRWVHHTYQRNRIMTLSHLYSPT